MAVVMNVPRTDAIDGDLAVRVKPVANGILG